MVERASGHRAAARRRARRRRLLTGGAAVVAICMVGGGVALAAGRKTGPTYRTAVAAVGSVEQTLDAVGSVVSATRYDTAFSVAGTVGHVAVSVGDTVAAGAVLATLDTAALDDAVEQAESTLADATQQLEDDLESQTATSVTTVTASTATPTASASAAADPPAAGPAGPAGSAPVAVAVATAVAAVANAQRQLLGQYDVTSASLDVSRSSVADSRPVCEAFLAPSTDDVTPTDDAPTAAALVACQKAISQVLVDQESVDTAQAALLTLAGALDDAVAAAQTTLTATQTTLTAAQAALAAAQAAASTTAGPATGSATSTAEPTTTAAASSTGGPVATSQAASAATILADRAAISLDEAKVSIAKNALTMVILTSPIDGTVAAVSIAAGDTVSASSTSAVITVIGNDGYVVTTTVPLSEIDTVEVGQSAEMTVASTSKVLGGSVSSIGILNVSTSSSDPSYTVVIAVDDTDERLFNGASAQVTVTTSQQGATLAVPISAVHVDGSTSTVQVLRAGKAVDGDVETGAVGSEVIEITSGLVKGDKVVLADLSQGLVSQDRSTTDSGLTGLGGTTGTIDRQMPAGGPSGVPPGS